jgi:DNA-binding transcriptional MerR regulator
MTSAPITPTPGSPLPGHPAGAARWRIDDLAHRSGLTVDTIRYYRREGLLPEGARAGRAKLYGPEHLRRLERIRELQGRRFSLAAIRALLVADREGLEGVFGDRGEGTSYTLDELIERSGIEPALAGALRESGLLRDPAEYGRATFDGDDLELLCTMAELHRLGLPEKALVELGTIYAQGIEATQQRVVDLFSSGGDVDWGPGELEAFQSLGAATAPRILPLARRLVDYTHHRTIQRLTLGAIERKGGDRDTSGPTRPRVG